MQRQEFIDKISQASRVNPIVALLGPRQCGKTTLAKICFNQFFKSNKIPLANYFDLEDF